eukprot:scaffold5383_cov222-Amphora_coffeaeformis.AAC.21
MHDQVAETLDISILGKNIGASLELTGFSKEFIRFPCHVSSIDTINELSSQFSTSYDSALHTF